MTYDFFLFVIFSWNIAVFISSFHLFSICHWQKSNQWNQSVPDGQNNQVPTPIPHLSSKSCFTLKCHHSEEKIITTSVSCWV